MGREEEKGNDEDEEEEEEGDDDANDKDEREARRAARRALLTAMWTEAQLLNWTEYSSLVVYFLEKKVNDERRKRRYREVQKGGETYERSIEGVKIAS